MKKIWIYKKTGLILMTAMLFMAVFVTKADAAIESIMKSETGDMSILDVLFMEDDITDDGKSENIEDIKPQDKPGNIPDTIPGGGQATTSKEVAFVLCNNANIRELPEVKSKVLGTADYADNLSIVKKEGAFYQISTSNGTIGWIDDSAVAVIYRSGDSTGKLFGKTVVLDPGHGEIKTSCIDPGAIGKIKNLKEVDVTIDTALKSRDLLLKEGATVVMTRTGESTCLTLKGRTEVANYLKSDIFVSIHTNANDNASVNGISTYFYAPSSNELLSAQREERKNLASNVQTSIIEFALRKDRGLFEENFAVLRETKVPSILIEAAFISNAEEEELLSHSEFRGKLAQGICSGIKNYFK